MSLVVETIGLIASSGLVSSGITFFATRRIKRIDISQKTINFWEEKAETYLDKMTELDKRISGLEELKCEKPNCENRI